MCSRIIFHGMAVVGQDNVEERRTGCFTIDFCTKRRRSRSSLVRACGSDEVLCEKRLLHGSQSICSVSLESAPFYASRETPYRETNPPLSVDRPEIRFGPLRGNQSVSLSAPSSTTSNDDDG